MAFYVINIILSTSAVLKKVHLFSTRMSVSSYHLSYLWKSPASVGHRCITTVTV